MKRTRYGWERYWRPRGERVQLQEGAFLPNPEDEWSRTLNPNVVPLQYLDETMCLILLGEAGSGKSVAVMECGKHALKQRTEIGETNSVWVNLGNYRTEQLVINKIFDCDAINKLRENQESVDLFLDGFDECLLSVPNLPRLLVDELESLSNAVADEQLRLRIVCRTLSWPNELSKALKKIWGTDGYAEYLLAPLRERDVVIALEDTGIEPTRFLSEMRRLGAQPMAAGPQTLQMMMREFQKHGSFPPTRGELFAKGCEALCAAYSNAPMGTRRDSYLSDAQRLAVAERIAAVSFFSGRENVVVATEEADAEADGLVRAEDLVGQEISPEHEEFTVDLRAIQETLNSGLFGSEGTNYAQWNHRMYGEYLAAKYVDRHRTKLPQILDLIVHPGDPSGKLVPPLHETAAWIASLRTDVFEELLDRSPDVLLRSDAASVDAEYRSRLAAAILERFDRGTLFQRDWEERNLYQVLDHPRLAIQLRPYLIDKSRNPDARTAAVAIADVCNVMSVADDLVIIALDSDEQITLRADAAYAIARIGDGRVRARLRPLVAGDAADEQDELKGCALRAVWPEHLSGEELFEALKPPKSELIGAYRSFLYHNPMNALDANDLPIALNWAVGQLTNGARVDEFDRLIRAIVLRAFDHLSDSNVCQRLTQLVWKRVCRYEPILGWATPYGEVVDTEEQDLSENIRRTLVTQILRSIPEARNQVDLLLFQQGLVSSIDTFWLLSELEGEGDNEIKAAIAKLIGGVVDLSDSSQFAAVYAVRDHEPILREVTREIFEPIELGSAKADALRRRYEEWTEIEERRRDRPVGLTSADIVTRVERLLDDLENGSTDAWWSLNLELTVEPGAKVYGDEFEVDLTRLPGWTVIDEQLRSRVTAGASTYLALWVPDTSRWFGRNTIWRPDWAGYRALHLLWQRDPLALDSFGAEEWARWATVIVGLRGVRDSADLSTRQSLVFKAYEQAASEVITALTQLMEWADSDNGSVETALSLVDLCWDDALARSLVGLIAHGNLRGASEGIILAALLDRNVPEAREIAEKRLRAMAATDDEMREGKAGFALQMIEHLPDAGWDMVWPILQQDPAVGERVCAGLSWRDWNASNIAERLTVDQLGKLFTWLERRFPHSEDPTEPGMHVVTERERLGQWRNFIIQRIELRGTLEAVATLRGIMAEFPDLKWLRWPLSRAEEVAAAESWEPPTPREILRLFADQRIRYVQNAQQLLDVVVESLERLEAKLQLAESRADVDIWNVISPAAIRADLIEADSHAARSGSEGAKAKQPKYIAVPKEENLVTDYIKRHLDDDLGARGTIVNREVQNERGKRTDIRIQAVDSSTERPSVLAVIVEVKGCWHRELDSAMEEQLVSNYLRPQGLRHGLYLVAWFNCDRWYAGDARNRDAPDMTIEEARTHFATQAEGLRQADTYVRSFVLDARLNTHV